MYHVLSSSLSALKYPTFPLPYIHLCTYFPTSTSSRVSSDIVLEAGGHASSLAGQDTCPQGAEHSACSSKRILPQDTPTQQGFCSLNYGRLGTKPGWLAMVTWLVRVRKSVLSGSERDSSGVSPTPSRSPLGQAGLQQEPSFVSVLSHSPSSLGRASLVSA